MNRLRLVPLLGLVAMLQLVAPGTAANPTIDAVEGGGGGYSWQPATAAIAPGGAVTFRSTDAVVTHGVTWTGGPEKPSCSGVPIDVGKANWSGDCAFGQAGNYSFVCTVHPVEMKGSVSVGTAGGPPGTSPPPGGRSESPLEGPASRALRLAKSQRGSVVRGSINLSQASSGGRLEVLLLANRSVLTGAGNSATSTVGRLKRSSLKAGRVSFAVPLKGVARRVLRDQEKLSLKVRVKVAPPGRAALTLTRGVVLRVPSA
jgi:plastocyanin